MPNAVLTPSVIANEALFILDNELGVLDTFHRAHEDEFSKKVNGYKVGETISIRRPADFTVRNGATMAAQDVIEGSTTLTLDQRKGIDFKFTTQDLTLRVEDLSERVIKPAMISLVNDIALDCLTQMYRGTFNWVGTPNGSLDSYAKFLAGTERLNIFGVPDDGKRYAVLNPRDRTPLVGALPSLFSPEVAKAAIRRGQIGTLDNIDVMMTQVIPNHTTGNYAGAAKIRAASSTVTYESVRNTMTQALSTDTWTSAVTLRAGDVFTIAGVNAVNPRTKQDTGVLQQFVVVSDTVTNATTGNETLVTVSPPIIASGPHQTVAAGPAQNALISMVGAASTVFRQNLVYHKNAFAVAFAPLDEPPGAVQVSRKSKNGISVRVIPVYDGITDESAWRLDVLYGRRVINPRMATRLSG